MFRFLCVWSNWYGTTQRKISPSLSKATVGSYQSRNRNMKSWWETFTTWTGGLATPLQIPTCSTVTPMEEMETFTNRHVHGTRGELFGGWLKTQQNIVGTQLLLSVTRGAWEESKGRHKTKRYRSIGKPPDLPRLWFGGFCGRRKLHLVVTQPAYKKLTMCFILHDCWPLFEG